MHVNKTDYPAGSYVVLVKSCDGEDCWKDQKMPENYVYKLTEDSSIRNFIPQDNGWDLPCGISLNGCDKLHLRPAHPAEIKAYDNAEPGTLVPCLPFVVQHDGSEEFELYAKWLRSFGATYSIHLRERYYGLTAINTVEFYSFDPVIQQQYTPKEALEIFKIKPMYDNFVIKCPKDAKHPDWIAYIEYIRASLSVSRISGDNSQCYYGFRDGKACAFEHCDLPNNVEVKPFSFIKEFLSLHTQQDDFQYISRQDLARIHSIACSGWKVTLESYAKRDVFSDKIRLTSTEVSKMFRAATAEQKPVLEKYLVDTEFDMSFTNMFTTGENANKHKGYFLNNKYKWQIEMIEGKPFLFPTYAN